MSKKTPNVSENLEKGPSGGTEWDTESGNRACSLGAPAVWLSRSKKASLGGLLFSVAGRSFTPFASEHSLDLCVG